MTIDEISDNFFLLDEWEDRYRYIIELGRTSLHAQDILRCSSCMPPRSRSPPTPFP